MSRDGLPVLLVDDEPFSPEEKEGSFSWNLPSRKKWSSFPRVSTIFHSGKNAKKPMSIWIMNPWKLNPMVSRLALSQASEISVPSIMSRKRGKDGENPVLG